ncbi:hypothetical protein AAES_162581 [Amazona aestiva]|uniref:Uncharacterized protein n=1 Tax=Amazona aestiva TaxID=12930 RepID=A0A0Q3UQ45_AMAAE|nr:hypothetical protein AAES_162581 [Amazona aestiva]
MKEVAEELSSVAEPSPAAAEPREEVATERQEETAEKLGLKLEPSPEATEWLGEAAAEPSPTGVRAFPGSHLQRPVSPSLRRMQETTQHFPAKQRGKIWTQTKSSLW